MARKKQHPAHANHERWLVSYADFITLLFAFFVVMFASSQTDKAKARMVGEAVKEALEKGGVRAVVHEVLGGTVDERGKGNAMLRGPGGTEPKDIHLPPPTPTVGELLPSLNYLSKALEAEIKDGKIELQLEPRGLVLHMRQAAFFPSGDDSVDPKTYAAIDKIGETIRALPNAVRLEGHTDSVPIHTARFRSNWELSAARSISMLDQLANRCGIARERMAIAGYADTIPVASNDTDEGRARNRRVDIVVLNQQIAVQPGSDAEPAAPPSQPPTPDKKPAAPEKK
ncbi:MAG TPA: flagellar motor protein MotB [Bryobacteraceae bacterium]|nr:flagellar motor protein MotB [Bryobacteraceae bacterium]